MTDSIFNIPGKLSMDELTVLINQYIQKRDYVRDMRWTARNLHKKGNTRSDWDTHFKCYDAQYNAIDARIRQLRKISNS